MDRELKVKSHDSKLIVSLHLPGYDNGCSGGLSKLEGTLAVTTLDPSE
jgi:hypothetical protein